jgi:hypothetical protein
LLIPWLLL